MNVSGLADLESWLDEIQSRAGEYVNKTQLYVINTLVRFRDKRGELNFQYNKLRANPPPANAPASLRANYQATLAMANDAREKAAWLGKLTDTFTNVTGLGALPALIAGVPIAVMLAAAVALTILITNITAAISKYLGAKQIAEAATAGGRDPQSALETYYAQQKGGGFFGDVSQLVWPLALAGGAFLLLSNKRR